MKIRPQFAVVCLAVAQVSFGQTPPPAAQNPSPMAESTREHARIAPRELAGIRRTFNGPLDKPVEVFVPASTTTKNPIGIVIHFLGAPFIPEYAVSELANNSAVAVVSIGFGSGIFDRTFTPPLAFDSLLANIKREVNGALGSSATFGGVTLVGFSAGHGAIRAILRDSAHFANVGAVLLLDGMHTSYVPEGQVLDKGGTVDESNLVIWEKFAREAVQGRKRFLVTHSEIFPGTFASTTETADWLTVKLGLKRTPVLKWGPGGMQQLSEVHSGKFEILGFAGNSAPDHIDQFQGLPLFLRRLFEL